MKIVFTGAGGGHFYPLIAVAERIKKEIALENIEEHEFFFFSDKEYNKVLLEKNEIKFVKIPAGKIRLYFSFQNIIDPFISLFGTLKAIVKLFIIYPDVIFAKGGYSSMPVVFAAKFLFIPIIVHESDTVPGRTNILIGKIAKRVAVSYASAIKYFDIKKTAYTGQPIMSDYLPKKEDLERKISDFTENIINKNRKNTILICGGSQGSEIINEILLESLSVLLEKYNIIHQVGDNNLHRIKISTDILLENNINKEDYFYFGSGDLSKYYEAADICITRAGSALFEISAWGIPSIIIPITNSNGNHQMINASTFENAGCSVVIEEVNLKKDIFINEINSILENPKKYNDMQFNNLNNFKSGAAETIAKEIVKIALTHEY